MKNHLQLNGGTVEDAEGNAARLKLPASFDQSGHKVNGPVAARGVPVEPPAKPEPFTDSHANSYF